MVHPMASRPLRCWSMGRAPIAQPPGSETRARPKRATRGPRTRTLARICFTSSYGASGRTLDPAATSTSGAATLTSRPRNRRSAAVVSMSRSAGTFRSLLAPSERSVAQRIGSAAFLAPLIRTVPRSGPPPRTTMASILFGLRFLGGAHACLEFSGVALFVVLLHARDGEGVGGDVARDGRPGRDVGVCADGDRRDEL